LAKTLLVADDSATMRRVVEMTFAGEDVQVVTAATGEAALQRAKDIKPDVILADAQMGAMSGYELCRAVKADAALRGASVIVMSSQHTPYDEALGRDVGADDHCIKPFDTQALIDKVKTAVAKGATTKMAVAATAPPAAVTLTPPPSTMVTPSPRPTAPSGPPAPATIKTPAAPPPPTPPAVKPAPPAAPVTVMHAAPPPPAAAPAEHSLPPSAIVSDAAEGAASHLAAKAAGMGLTAEQAAAIARLTREVVERVVWEVVPDLAETIIREEIRRLTRA
jgi:CheY-like chemotaxis protein